MKTAQFDAPVLAADVNSRRLQRISSTLALACLVLIVVLPPVYTWFWVTASPGQLATRVNLSAAMVQGPLMLWQRVVGGVISTIPLGLFLAGLWQARKCFGLFAGGHVFTHLAVEALKRFAMLVAASFAASLVTKTALSTLLTIYNVPGTRQVAIGLGTDQIFTLFFAGMVWLMAAVIAQGMHLAEENARFV